MIHVVDVTNFEAYRDRMEEVWRFRHKIFVEGKGWTALARPDGREIDQFDTSSAVHFLAIEDGALIGYGRYMPTTCPTLLSEVFPHLCVEPPPRDPGIWEWTRHAVVREHRTSATASNIALLLMTGIIEWSLQHGVHTFVSLSPISYILNLVQMRYHVIPLGEMHRVDGERIIALSARFTDATLNKLQEMRGSAESVLVTPHEGRLRARARMS